METTIRPFELLRRWHATSMEYYIDNLIAQAVKDKAPEDALYKRQDGTWCTASDLPDNHPFVIRNCE